MADWMQDPNLQHDVLTVREMAMVCDVCNPGFALSREAFGYTDRMLAGMLRANVEDSFRLYPGSYEDKWQIDRDAMLTKLAALTPEQMQAAVCQVDAFWDAVTNPAAALGRRSSKAKARAARENGKLGGRPRKGNNILDKTT